MTIQLSQVSDNICMQLISLQTAIAQRADGVPTQQEVNMQVRLINCLDKMSRYMQRMEKAAQQAGLSTAAAAVARQQPMPPANVASDENPPVTQEEFEEKKMLLQHYQNVKNDFTIPFRGKEVNSAWLLYNIFQYCLPQPQRRFIASEEEFVNTIPLPALRASVQEFLHGRVAA